MRKPTRVLLTALLALLPATAGYAAPPATLSYQGVLTDGQGVVVQDGTYTLDFDVFTEENDVTPIFHQQIPVVVTHGLYNVILSGNAGTLPDDLAMAFDAQNQGRFMQVTIVTAPDPMLNGTVLSPRQEIASVPYALSALSVVEAAPPPTREVVFEVSTLNQDSLPLVEVTDQSGDWTTLRNSENTGDLVASVAVPAASCTVEVDAMASFTAPANDREVLLRITENTAAVGVSTVGVIAGDGGQILNSFVNRSPAPGTLDYRLDARALVAGITQGVSEFSCGGACGPDSDAGAYLKVVMECQD